MKFILIIFRFMTCETRYNFFWNEWVIYIRLSNFGKFHQHLKADYLY